MRVRSLGRLSGGILLLTLTALFGPGAVAQSALTSYEIGVDAGNVETGITVSLYNAFTGEQYWTSLVTNTNPNDDLTFDTGGPLGGGVRSSTYAGRTDVIVPQVGLFVIEFTSDDFSSPLAYAWGDHVAGQAIGSFYRPVPFPDSPDTRFTYVTDHMSVQLVEGAGTTTALDATLGERGWTLPYDRATLCAAVTCTGSGPYGPGPRQFISAGVTTAAVAGQPTWRKLVPTFSFEGDVTPASTWGTLSWSVPDLRLQFASGKRLALNTPLNATGTVLTSTGATAGWSGVQFTAGSGGTFDGVIVERVTGYGETAVSVTNASPTISNSTIQRNSSLSSAVTGLRVTGSSAAPTVDKTQIIGMTNGGVVVYGQADLRMTDSFVTGNAGTGIVAGYLSEVFLYPATDRAEALRTHGTEVTGNTGTGITATSSASVVMGIYYYPYDGHHVNGFDSAVSNTGRGIAASSGSTIYAGGTTNWQRNRFFGNTGNDAESAGSGTSVPIRCDWWNDTTPPFRTAVSGGATLDASYWLLQDPYVNPNATCTSVDISDGFGRTGGAAAREAGVTEGNALANQLSDALGLPPAEAVAALIALARAAPEAPEAGAAVTQIARLAGAEDAPDGARAFVDATAEAPGPMQTAARQALVGLRHNAGDADGALAIADALAASEDGALVGQVARVYLLHDAGREAEALDALATVEALAPQSVEAWMARMALGLEVDGPPEERAAQPREEALVVAKHEAAGAFSIGVVTPNPASGRTEIAVTLDEAQTVRVVVLDMLGREVAVVADGAMEAGTHRAALDVNGLTPGAYLVRVTAGSAVETRRLTVVR